MLWVTVTLKIVVSKQLCMRPDTPDKIQCIWFRYSLFNLFNSSLCLGRLEEFVFFPVPKPVSCWKMLILRSIFTYSASGLWMTQLDLLHSALLHCTVLLWLTGKFVYSHSWVCVWKTGLIQVCYSRMDMVTVWLSVQRRAGKSWLYCV